jgi:ankyrin repeat protein
MCNALQAACINRNKHKKDEGNRYLEIAEHLLKNGADPNMHGGEYGDALQAAVVGSAKGNVLDNNIDLVKLVLDYGGEINYRGGKYHSAMRASVFGGNISAAHVLIKRGAEIDDEIFLLAIEYKRKSIIPLLLEKGVDVNAGNESGTALQLAIRSEDEVTTDILLSHSNIDVNALGRTYEAITALYLAIQKKNKDLVKRLLSLGARINQPSDGSTCLSAAIFHEDAEMLELLIAHGADINANTPGQDSALMTACSRENKGLVQYLLEHGALVNLWVANTGDALQQAAATGNESIVKLLLANGADVKAPQGADGSCLECAIRANRPALARLLLDAGAHVNFSRPIDDLRQPGVGLGGPLSTSIKFGQNDLMQLLIERGAMVNWTGHFYYGTPLQVAIQADNEYAVKLLLENGADVDMIGGYRGSAPAYAILKDNETGICEKYVQLILDAGANVNPQPGQTSGGPLAVSEILDLSPVRTGKILTRWQDCY